jgi:cation:H+ antiporter
MILQIVLFIASCFILSWLSTGLIKVLIQIAKYLGWREFIIGFFVMAFATSLPNLFVDVSAALRGMPNLAFGDVVGGNLVDLTLIMGLAVLFGKKSSTTTKSKTVQTSAIFTGVIAILPLLLILDGYLGRIDGIILLLSFVVYVFWMFSKQERFVKVYSATKKEKKDIYGAFWFLINISKLVLFLALLVATSFVIINSAQIFSEKLGASLSLIGILIIGLGNCFPEAYFSIISAKRGEGWLALGDLMGSVIVCATLVLGIVALLVPFRIDDFSPFFVARIFTIIAIVFYLLVIRTGKQITKKEGLLLLSIYVIFLLTEVFIKF